MDPVLFLSLQVGLDFHTQVVKLRRFLRETHDPPLRRLARSLATFTQEDITSAVLRAHRYFDAKGLKGNINSLRRSQVSAQLTLLRPITTVWPRLCQKAAIEKEQSIMAIRIVTTWQNAAS